MPKVAFGKVQWVQKVEETPNEFKRTRLVISMVGGYTESGGGGKQVEGCDWEKVLLLGKVSPLSKQYLSSLTCLSPHHEPPLLFWSFHCLMSMGLTQASGFLDNLEVPEYDILL